MGAKRRADFVCSGHRPLGTTVTFNYRRPSVDLSIVHLFFSASGCATSLPLLIIKVREIDDNADGGGNKK